MNSGMFIRMGLALPFGLTALSINEKTGSDSIASLVATFLFAVYCLYAVAYTAFEKEEKSE